MNPEGSDRSPHEEEGAKTSFDSAGSSSEATPSSTDRSGAAAVPTPGGDEAAVLPPTADEAGEEVSAQPPAADGGGGDAEGADEQEVGDGEAEEQPQVPSRFKWYAVHTYSGHENKARLALLERIKNAGLQDKFGEVLIPTESVVEMVKGKRRTTTRKFYPGYMFVQMDLDDHSFHLVKSTPKITGFLGGTKPVPVKDEEIAGINRQMTEGAIKPKPKVSFEHGEQIRVVDGPFSNFTGIVEEVRPEKQKVRVLVSIFGRATPVELDFVQVEKA